MSVIIVFYTHSHRQKKYPFFSILTCKKRKDAINEKSKNPVRCPIIFFPAYDFHSTSCCLKEFQVVMNQMTRFSGGVWFAPSLTGCSRHDTGDILRLPVWSTERWMRWEFARCPLRTDTGDPGDPRRSWQNIICQISHLISFSLAGCEPEGKGFDLLPR